MIGSWRRRAGRAAILVTAGLLGGSGCAPGGSGPAAGDGAGVAATAQLELVDATTEIYCDGAERPVGDLRGAEPGEPLALSSPVPVQLTDDHANAVADADGTFRLTWRCQPSEAGQPWELNVRGTDSGRWITINIVGTAADPALADVLHIDQAGKPVLCDRNEKIVGELSNAYPYETLTFAGDVLGELRPGEADAGGNLTLTWTCSPRQAGTSTVTVTGLRSGRVGAFTVEAVAPRPEPIPTPTVSFSENPFVCDGGSRVFATVAGFQASEPVEFTSPQAAGIRQGQADSDGDLPVRWTCGAADAGTTWELTATGVRSGRTVTFTLTGAAAPAPADPDVTLLEDPFVCDGTTRFAAAIRGFVPNEYVDFTSPQAEQLRQGQADASGALQVRWTCDAGESDRIWDLTATGATSQRSASFRITGAAAPAG